MDKHVLKTYEDGSELTTTTLAATIAAGLVLAGTMSYAAVKVSNWRYTRWLKKNGHHAETNRKIAETEAP
jgi:hypothetical protein